MKILYSQLKQLIPGLKAGPKEISHKFTMAGLMMDSLTKVNYLGKADYLISLEVRQNRPDCLSIVGLAREVAAYYNLKTVLPAARKFAFPKQSSEITVKAKNKVKRALAFEIVGVENQPSPNWLKSYLAFYDINSINLLVDLSNYVMILTGYPSHLLDSDKMNGSLIWDLNQDFKKVVTLDKTEIALRGGEVIIRDQKSILGLAGIVGGQTAALSLKTKNIIAEMAVYDRVSIRADAKALKIATDASFRLEKDLSAAGLEYAASLLISMILYYAGGQVIKKPFSFYPRKQTIKKISFKNELASELAGIKIPETQSVQILKRLRFQVSINSVSPPLDRMDILLPEDVAEEIIRLYGFDKIPSDQPPVFAMAENITPLTFMLAEKLRNILTSLGFDEILSWTLTDEQANSETNYLDWEKIATQNSVNEEFPELRQSIAPSLRMQCQEYLKKNIQQLKLFEIGKVFGKKAGQCLEHDSLGLLVKKQDFQQLKQVLDTLLLSLGAKEVSYLPRLTKPLAANAFACWSLVVEQKNCGIIYKARQNYAFAELNLSLLSNLVPGFKLNPVVELNRKLVILDNNLEISQKQDLSALLSKLKKKLAKSLWSLELIDKFPLKGKTRYTIQVTYVGLSDQEAKAKHAQVFNFLKNQ